MNEVMELKAIYLENPIPVISRTSFKRSWRTIRPDDVVCVNEDNKLDDKGEFNKIIACFGTPCSSELSVMVKNTQGVYKIVTI